NVQSEIAEEIIKQLDLTILAPAREAIESRPTKNLEAYDFYLRGVDQWDRAFTYVNPLGYLGAVKMFEKAVELDPDFVVAYIWLSETHSWIYHNGIDMTEERLAKSKAAVDKALELAPDLPEALKALGNYYYRGFRDYDRALELFESVRRARPNSSPAPIGWIQRRQGKWEESLETLKEAFRLDPRSSNLAIEIGNNCSYLRKYEEADKWYDRALSLSPESINTKIWKTINLAHWKGSSQEVRAILDTFPPSMWTDLIRIFTEMEDRNYEKTLEILDALTYETIEFQDLYFNKNIAYANVYYFMKKPALMKAHADKARITLEELVREHPEDPRFRSDLGKAYAYLGRKDDAVREGNQAVNLFPVSKDAMAGTGYVSKLTDILIIIGEYDKAIEQLEYLMSIPAGQDLSLNSLQLSPGYDPIRDHPRFKRLIEKYSK
ncbi:MAG: tetratricopeptide repeat protein, partial [Candidatus Aminicenantes bacterium]|nr:tetratricopeptide repeat protein [Candidatus Aminicenantes bacterium]